MTTITKEKKKEIVKNLRENIKKQQAIFFVNFKGIKGEDSDSLRLKLRESGSKMVIARKTLIKIAFKEEGIDFDPLKLEGEAGFIFGFEDGVTTAKVIKEFSKEESITVLGGIYEGKILTVEEVETIASLPTRDELLAKLVGTISAPMPRFLNVLQGNTKGLITVLSKIKV